MKQVHVFLNYELKSEPVHFSPNKAPTDAIYPTTPRMWVGRQKYSQSAG